MTMTISEVAEKMKLSPHTLRFYDKEGLLPFVHRNKAGIRIFTEADLTWLSMIESLKETGMSLKEIRSLIDWSLKGDSTLQQRYELLCRRKQQVEAEMKRLQQSLEVLSKECWYYKTALSAGTESIHETFLNTSDYPLCRTMYDATSSLAYDLEKKIG